MRNWWLSMPLIFTACTVRQRINFIIHVGWLCVAGNSGKKRGVNNNTTVLNCVYGVSVLLAIIDKTPTTHVHVQLYVWLYMYEIGRVLYKFSVTVSRNLNPQWLRSATIYARLSCLFIESSLSVSAVYTDTYEWFKLLFTRWCVDHWVGVTIVEPTTPSNKPRVSMIRI